MSKFLSYDEFLNESEYAPTEAEKQTKFREISDALIKKYKHNNSSDARHFVSIAQEIMDGKDHRREDFAQRQGWAKEYADALVKARVFELYPKVTPEAGKIGGRAAGWLRKTSEEYTQTRRGTSVGQSMGIV